MAEYKKVKIPLSSLPPADSDNKYLIRYRIISSDKNQTSAWSPLYSVDGLPISQVESKLVLSSGTLTAIWGDENNRPKYDIFLKIDFDIQKASLTNNVATIHVKNDHTLSVGDEISVSGVGTPFDGGPYIITAKTTSTVSYAKNATNVAEFNVNPYGQASRGFLYHGTSPIHTYGLLSQIGDHAIIKIQVEGQFRVINPTLAISTTNQVDLV